MDIINQIKKLMVEIESDCTKYFMKGNHAAGIRARHAIQELKEKAQLLREATLDKEKKKTK
jgi:hypothetical protein